MKTEHHLITQLILREPTGIPLSVQVTKITLLQQESQPTECRLCFWVNWDSYQQIESEELFYLSPDLRGGMLTEDFLADLDVEITTLLHPELLSELEDCDSNAKTVATYLQTLSQEQPANPLLSTESWLILSIKQQQALEERIYRTVWDYIDWNKFVRDDTPEDTDELLGQAVVNFLKDSAASYLLAEADGDVNQKTVEATTQLIETLSSVSPSLVSQKEISAQQVLTSITSFFQELLQEQLFTPLEEDLDTEPTGESGADLQAPSTPQTATPLEELLPWLNRIDTLIQKAVLLAESHYSPDPATAPYRGLQISLEEVARLLQHHPAEPLFATAAKETAFPPATSRLAWLQQQFQLTPIDLDILALALAPELDRRYERLYAYLQDDIRAKHPTVDLALNLLCPTAGDKLTQRDRFSPDAPLIRHHLLHLHSQPDTPTPLLAQTLHLDAQIVRYLLGNNGLDSRLSNFCQLIHPTLTLNQLFLNPELPQKLSALAENHQHLRLYFQGTDTSSKRRAAEALAQELDTPLLAADISRLTANPKTDIEPTLNLLWREAWFQNALLYLDGWDNLPASDRALACDTLLTTPLPLTILSGTEPWNPTAGTLGVVTVPFPLPDFLQRRHCWQTHLNSAGISLTDSDLYAIADRFRLTSDRIADAVATACNQLRVEGKKDTQPKIADFFAAARAQSGHDLTRLARPIQPKYRLEDIVLPIEQKTQLREICDRATHQTKVLSEWGFDSHLSLGKGLNVLFTGVPGTGKTMAGEAIARELQLDLYKIDLSQIVSKYIGGAIRF